MKSWNFEDKGYWGCGMEIAHQWADYAQLEGRTAVWKFMDLLEKMISDEYDDNWEELEADLEKQFSKEEIEGSPYSSEIYCFFHAFVRIGQLEGIDEKETMFGLVSKHWNFLRFLYSVMLRRVIGCGFINFASVGNNLKSTPSYHPYLHLFYSAIMENKDDICSRGTKCEKLDKSLADIREIIGSTPRSEELDKLCQVLFPNRLKEYMENHRPKTYRELEGELNALRNSMDANTSQMQKLIDEQAKMLSALAETSVPIEVLSNELLRLPYGTSYEVFEKLNSLLIANEVWTKHAPEIRNRILERMQQPTVQATNYYAAGANHVDYQKHLHVTNDKKQIAQS